MAADPPRARSRFHRWSGGAKVVIDLSDDAPVEASPDLWEMAGMATAHARHARWETTPYRYRLDDEAIGSRFDPFIDHLAIDHPSEDRATDEPALPA